MAKVKQTKFEKRLEELEAKMDLPAKEAVLKAALVDVIAKQKAEDERQETEKLVIEEAEQAVKDAEADLAGKDPEEVEVSVEPVEVTETPVRVVETPVEERVV